MTAPTEENVSTGKQPLGEMYEEQLTRMLEQLHASSLITLDTMKMRIAHYEKFIVLCAGTAALSFTAAASLKGQHIWSAAAVPYLVRAWQLLLLGIVLAVIANWLTIKAAVRYGYSHFGRQASAHYYLLESIRSRPQRTPKEEQDFWQRPTREADEKSMTSANRYGKWAEYLGYMAQVAAFVAFAALYFFAKIELIG